MPKRRKLQNDQSVVFKYADKNNVAIGFINLLDDLDPADYVFFEANLVELIESKQITLTASNYANGGDDVDTSSFKLKSDA